MASIMSRCIMPLAGPLGGGRLAPGHIQHRAPLRPRRCNVRLQPAQAMHLEQLGGLSEQAAISLQPQLEQLLDRVAGLSLTLADVSSAVDTQQVAEAATEVGNKGGFFGPFAVVFENVLKVLDQGLTTLHVPYSYGFAIILLTIFVKILTFPLTKKQVVSTIAMQKLQPRVKEIQNKYKDDQQRAQLETANLYRDAQVNPLAGCLPTLATIPVFIGLYRALSNVAEEGLLKEGFFWIPSLGGPTTLAAQKAGGGFSWLLPLQDGAPPIGWPDALAYLSLPVLLVLSQYVSQKLISPPSQDPSQQSTQWILKFLPLLIGYFSLNVPSGLALYWFTNNILSTSQQAWLKSTYADTGSMPGPSASAVAEEERLEKVKQLTGQSTNARRSKTQVEQREQSGRKGDKFRALKAAEAARKSESDAAAKQGSASSNGVESSEQSNGAEVSAENAQGKSSRKKKKKQES